MVVFVCVWFRKVCGFDYFADFAWFEYWPHETPINIYTLLLRIPHIYAPLTPSVSLSLSVR